MAEHVITWDGNRAVFPDFTYALGLPSRRKRTVHLYEGDTVLHSDTMDIHLAGDRERFAGRLNGHGEIVLSELLTISAELQQHETQQAAEDDDERSKASQASAMVALAKAQGVALFHDAQGDPYATIPIGDHLETWPIKAKAFRSFLAHLYYTVHGSAPGGQATQDALTVLAGEALFAGDERQVWTRIAFTPDAIYLDLADADWRAVEITAAGYAVRSSKELPAGLVFRRPAGMLPLPEPTAGGSLADLAPFFRLEAGDPELMLLAGWLLGIFQRYGGRAVLDLYGPQGSGKSTRAGFLVDLVDPCTVPLRRPPKEEADLLIAARNRAVVAFDNLSKLPDELSDAFCRLSTGGGLGKRTLYTDDDETLLNAQRPVILTGIVSVARNGDLIDRAIRIELDAIDDEQREAERRLRERFEAARPALLGALLEAVATGLRNRDAVALSRRPRMADFCEWVEACAPALGWEAEAFLAVYEGNREGGNLIAVEASPVGQKIVDLMTANDRWKGTASKLLTDLEALASDALKREREWPKQANTLSRQLKRLSPDLAKIGIWIEWDRTARKRVREIVLSRNANWRDPENEPHEKEWGKSSSASSAPPEYGQKRADFREESADDTDPETSSADRPQSSASSSAGSADEGDFV